MSPGAPPFPDSITYVRFLAPTAAESATPERRNTAAHRVGDHDALWVDARCEQATVTLSQSLAEALSFTHSGRPLNPETMCRLRTGDRQPVRRSLVRLEHSSVSWIGIYERGSASLEF